MIHDSDGLKLQVDVVGLDLTALIDTSIRVRLAWSNAEIALGQCRLAH